MIYIYIYIELFTFLSAGRPEHKACRGDWGTSDMGYHLTGLFNTEIILRFVRHLVNGTKTNQFPFSTLLLVAVGHPWHVCKLRSIFYTKSTFLG